MAMGYRDHRDTARWEAPPAPRIPIASLPAESPVLRPARPPSAQPWATIASRHADPALHRPTMTPGPPRAAHNHPDMRMSAPVSWGASASYHAAAGYNPVRGPATQYGDGDGQSFAAASGSSYAATRRPQVADATTSTAPARAAPAPASILKSSNTRRSLSISGDQLGPPVAAPPRPDHQRHASLGKLQITTVYNIKKLKEEAISLSWPLVKYDSRPRAKQPLLYFDIAFDPRRPESVRDNRRGALRPLREEDRYLPVSTHCAVTTMAIECPHLGKITVAREDGLRCIDVFAAIYDAYRERLRGDEAPKDVDGQYARYFLQRCRDSPAPAGEHQAGMLRVDVLKGRRIFDGLARSGADWKLMFFYPSA